MRNFTELNARNIVNWEELEEEFDELREDLDESEDPEILLWVNTTLKKYLQNDYKRVSRVTEFKESDPDWLKKSVKEGTALKVDWDWEFRDDVINIIEYFLNLGDKEDIPTLKFEKALERAKKWSKDLHENEGEEDPKGITVIREYPDDFKWVKVFSQQSLDREGFLMRHCVGSYFEKVFKGKCKVYSLRNEKNIPKCTIEVIKNEVKQIKGFANGAIQEKYVKYVRNFIEKPVKGEKYKKINEKELQNIGILLQDGIWHNMFLLDKNFTVKGNISFRTFKTLKKLPEGLTVKGNLDLRNCISLESLPEGLTIGGYLYLNGCISLKSLSEKLTVTTLDLQGCTSLKSLPKTLTVKDRIYVDETFPIEKYSMFEFEVE